MSSYLVDNHKRDTPDYIFLPLLFQRALIILLYSLLICLSHSRVTIGADTVAELLPDAPKGWIKSESPQTYNRQNLFDYIDGGAEVYLAYDFRQLVVQKYVPKAQDSLEKNSITVEIGQMSLSADAYGIFSLDQEGEKTEIGQMGVYNDGLLRFWKDVFFVRILEVTGASKDVILKLGREIDKKIKKEGMFPLLVSKIPSDNLIPGTVHYFHKQINLNNIYYFSDQNVLNLNMETNCASADFKLGDEKLKLLLIQYPDTITASRAEENMKSVYLEKESPSEREIFKTKEGKLVGMDVIKNYLILIFEGKEKKNVISLLNLVKPSFDRDGQSQTKKCFQFH